MIVIDITSCAHPSADCSHILARHIYIRFVVTVLVRAWM